MRHRKPSFRGLGKASGAAIASITVRIFECNGCHAQYSGDKPQQCRACGRLDFSRIDSKAEAYRLGELRLLQHAGIIRDLERQVRFPLMAARADGFPVKVGEYWADFTYFRVDTSERVIEDAKGNAMTDLAQWKLRHMAAQGTPVTIITPKGKL